MLQHRVLVAEHRSEVRAAVVGVLGAVEAFSALGTDSGSLPLTDAIEAFGPDVLVLGSGPTQEAALQALRDVRKRWRGLPVVLFSPHFAPGSPVVRQALALGGCTRLPYLIQGQPEELPALLRESLVPWLEIVLLHAAPGEGQEHSHMEPLTPAEVKFVRTLVRQKAAVELESGQEYLVHVRLAPLAKRLGFATISELLARLEETSYGELHEEVVEAIVARQPAFFRDARFFQMLRSKVIPAIVKRRFEEQTLRIWSAGCATGEEPYTLAMILREDFPELIDWDVRIVASDGSAEAIEQAALGLFSQEAVSRGLPIQMLGRYFQRAESDWRVIGGLREAIEFRRIDLTESLPALPEFDLVLLRNVLPTMEEGLRNGVLERVRGAMCRGGFLFLGRQDTTLVPRMRPVKLGPTTGYLMAS